MATGPVLPKIETASACALADRSSAQSRLNASTRRQIGTSEARTNLRAVDTADRTDEVTAPDIVAATQTDCHRAVRSSASSSSAFVVTIPRYSPKPAAGDRL